MTKLWRLCSGVVLSFFMCGALIGAAQTRMSDKDVENMMKNLKNDAGNFRSNFNSAVGKSTIRGTDQEKQAKTLVQSFQKQTEVMLDQFKDKKKADAELATVRSSADQIDKLLASTPMGDKVATNWSKVKSELGTISSAFGTDNQPAATSAK
jgi:hypothetical protein